MFLARARAGITFWRAPSWDSAYPMQNGYPFCAMFICAQRTTLNTKNIAQMHSLVHSQIEEILAIFLFKATKLAGETCKKLFAVQI